MSTLLDLRAYELGLNSRSPEDVIRSSERVAALVDASGKPSLWESYQQGLDDSGKPRATSRTSV